MTNLQSDIHENEIDLLEIFKILWENKIRIVVITSIAAFISIIYSLLQPNIYRADALLAPANNEGGGGVSRMAGQFGGLASLAGISLPSNEGDKKSKLGLEVLKSKKFAREFIGRHKISHLLSAVDYWDTKKQKLILDDGIYDEKAKTWLDKNGPPSDEELYKTYLNHLIIEDTGSEFIRIGFQHISPEIAAEWTGLVIKDLNDAIRKQDINEAQSSIAYLKKQIEISPLAELRKLFYNLIQSQTETMMLANVREEYVFRTIDPATVPEVKSEPNRKLICLKGTFLGAFIALIFVFANHYIRPSVFLSKLSK